MPKKIGYIISLTLLVLACGSNRNVVFYEGYLAFKLIMIGSSPVLKDSTGKVIFNYLEGIENTTELNEHETVLLDYFNTLKANNLIGEPFIYLTLANNEGELFQVFLDAESFNSIKKYDENDLQKRKKKIKITFWGEKIPTGIIKASKILSIEEVNGKTIITK